MSKTTTLSEIINTPTSENSWVDGAFKAAVTQTRSPSGKIPGKALLVDCDNGAITLDASFFDRDPSMYEGKIVSFGGSAIKSGIKKGDFKGKAQITIYQKARVEVFQDLSDGVAGKHMPVAAPKVNLPIAASAAAIVKPDFNEELHKIGWMWLHSLKQALIAKETAHLTYGYELSKEEFQSCISCIFIEANRKGLAASVTPVSK
jgi:hypothetical protein